MIEAAVDAVFFCCAEVCVRLSLCLYLCVSVVSLATERQRSMLSSSALLRYVSVSRFLYFLLLCWCDSSSCHIAYPLSVCVSVCVFPGAALPVSNAPAGLPSSGEDQRVQPGRRGHALATDLQSKTGRHTDLGAAEEDSIDCCLYHHTQTDRGHAMRHDGESQTSAKQKKTASTAASIISVARLTQQKPTCAHKHMHAQQSGKNQHQHTLTSNANSLLECMRVCMCVSLSLSLTLSLSLSYPEGDKSHSEPGLQLSNGGTQTTEGGNKTTTT